LTIEPPPPLAPDVVTRDATGRTTIRAIRLTEPLDLDGRLDESIYGAVPAIAGFVQQVPDEGESATENTEIWIFYDDRNVYVAGRCWDSHPERMVVNEMRRDQSNIYRANESFTIILDTFYDRRNGFYFMTNPLEGLYDSHVTNERDNNIDWNTVWVTRSERFKGGWTVEMAIPFKSLRYRQGREQVWGINVRRGVRWKNEESYLSPIPASYGPRGVFKLSSAATLVGLEAPGGSRNLEIKPYAISSLTTNTLATPSLSNDVGGDVGFDVKLGLTEGLTADLTYNTDFAQVEEDEQQINLTRFSLLFPEKREFFLEGQGIFNFGGVNSQRGGGAGSTRLAPIMFFSRRIGLSDGQPVPITAGGRVTGRLGDYTIGLLNIQTGRAEDVGVEPTNFSVVRVRRDVFSRSAIGFIGTHRVPSLSGGQWNQVLGVDADMAFFQNLRVQGYYARSRTPGVSGDAHSYEGEFAYVGDKYGFIYDHLRIGENFDPQIGFIRRRDLRSNFVEARVSPRPRSIAAIRKWGITASLDHLADGRGRLETREARGRFNIDFENNDRMNVEYTHSYEFLDDTFEIQPDVLIPPGSYRFQDVSATYTLGAQRTLAGSLTVARGSFFSGDQTQGSYSGRLEITPQVSIEPRMSINRVVLAEGRFTTVLTGARATYTMTPRMFVGVLVQHNSSVGSLASNIRLRWEYEPGSDLFVVYSEGRDTDHRGFPLLQNRSFVVKLTRLLRF